MQSTARVYDLIASACILADHMTFLNQLLIVNLIVMSVIIALTYLTLFIASSPGHSQLLQRFSACIIEKLEVA